METYLSTRGYVITKESVTDDELARIKNELTVKPIDAPGYGPESESFRTFLESKNKLYIPKYYGLQKFGIPTINKLPQGADIVLPFTGCLRPKQLDAVDLVLSACKDPAQMGAILCLNCGEGKCLGKDTPVIMYDGTIKMVQNVKVGDTLMGDDSTPRNVMSICSGTETLYKIVQDKGDSYIVNESHILSLKSIVDYSDDLKKGQVIDMSVKDFLDLSQYLHDKAGALCGFKVAVEFAYKETSLNPYTFGYCLGNGSIKVKNIPQEYKCNTRNIRLQVLAGLLDSVGCATADGYELSLIDVCLMKDVIYLARSLGFACFESGTRSTIRLAGRGIGDIPTKVLKRIASSKDAIDMLVTDIHVEKLEAGTYYGFTIDGNSRFLLGDFTVTHNTVCALHMISALAKKTLIVVHKEFLLQQWRERIQEFLPSAKIGLIKAQTIDVNDKDIVLASLQSLSMKELNNNIFDGIGTVVYDEVHRTSAKVFSKAYQKFTCTYSIGLTATPKRKDGLTKVFMWNIGDIAFKSEKRKDNLSVRFMEYYKPDPIYSKNVCLFNKKPNVTRMINNICEYNPRTQFIIEVIKAVFRNEPNRRMIVMSDRRSHLELLKKLLDNDMIDCGLYYGGMSDKQLKETEERKVILASYAMSSEGLDVKGLDTMIFASPKTDVVQASGRILRTLPHERQYVPLIIDVVDNFSVFKNQAKKRYAYYKSCKYIIEDKDEIFVKPKSVDIPKGQYLFHDE